MTTLDDWRALQRDVDAATGPDWKLGHKLDRLVYGRAQAVPFDVASLDAITALIEREMPERMQGILDEAVGDIEGAPPTHTGRRLCKALLAAFIRARIADLEQSEAAA